jgi:ADP-dependent NAD(P)H-hydrate dehydratase
VMRPRAADSNKGDFGNILVVAGSRGMSGAAVLCGRAALRAGAGLVHVAVPLGVWPMVAAAEACYLTVPLPEDDQGRFGDVLEQVLDVTAGKDVLALGPGLGRSPLLTKLVTGLVTGISLPIVLDADGLNALESQVDVLSQRTAPLILTPHPGEFARLLRTTTAAVQASRDEHALRFAEAHGVTLVLKGHRSVVTDGRRIYRNLTGNPGLASGGTGDVLTGVIAALLGQGLEPFAAAQLGVHVHGLAGDLARDEVGEISLIASDLLDHLPQVFRNLPH